MISTFPRLQTNQTPYKRHTICWRIKRKGKHDHSLPVFYPGHHDQYPAFSGWQKRPYGFWFVLRFGSENSERRKYGTLNLTFNSNRTDKHILESNLVFAGSRVCAVTAGFKMMNLKKQTTNIVYL